MLTEKTLNKISHEYLNGGVKQFHPEISVSEKKVLLKYLFSLTACPCQNCQ